MTTTSLYSKMHALDMIAISNQGPLRPLELPTNMTYLMTSMTTHIPRTNPPQVPPMVALTCQQRNSTMLTEVWILKGIYPLKDEWLFGCSLKTRLADQTKTNNQPEIG